MHFLTRIETSIINLLLFRSFTQTLDGIDPSTFSKVPTKKKKKNVHHQKQASNQHKILNSNHDKSSIRTQPSMSDFGFGTTGRFNFKKHFSKTKHQMHQANFRRTGFSMPKISSFVAIRNHEIVMVKHKLKQDAIGDVCLPQCDVADVSCNCAKLFECVKSMDEYDLAVLTAGGYVDVTPGSETYGKFSVSTKELNLFGFDQNLRQKLQDIKDLVDSNDSSDEEQCINVLGECK